MEDKGIKWDYIKCEIRSVTLEHSIAKNKKRREIFEKLNAELETLQEQLSVSASVETLDQYNHIKEKLEDIYQEKVKGAILRSKVKRIEEGERNSTFFLNMEKRNAINKAIVKLETERGLLIENQTEILEECRNFYQKIYTQPSGEDIEEDLLSDFFIDNNPKLGETEKKLCEGLLTMEECIHTVKSMANGKSPGTDGLTVEFYKHFWSKIGTFVIESLNYAFEKGELSVDQRRGIITLLPKKGKKRILLKNWRPISLLNTDYKILTKCLAFRLKEVLPTIIDPDQTGFLKGRYIGENIRTISDLIDYTSIKNCPGIILLIDFEKAFDTINWKYIQKCLKYFNFGKSFIHWVQLIYNNIESTVINNGHASNFFSISRGIRQGCPISPYLFIIAVEVLAISIRANKNIKGIKVSSTEFKISQLADDTTLFLLDLLSVKNALVCLHKFHRISGLKINLDKTIAKGIGSLKDFMPDDDCGVKWTTGPVTTLGLTLGGEMSVIKSSNFDCRVKVMSNLLNMWLSRGLSLIGRVTILKSLALPLVQYPAFCLPITTEITQEIEIQIASFLWKHKRAKVKKNVIIQPIDNGGIKAPDFTSIVKANRVTWIKRLITSDGKWTNILKALIEPFSLDHFLQTHLTIETISAIPIPFYVEIIQQWNTLKEKPSKPAHYLEEILWENRFIQSPINLNKKCKSRKKAKTKPLWVPSMYASGIVKVKHLIDNHGNIMDFNSVKNKYGMKCNILTYYKVVKAIPSDWLEAIKNYDQRGKPCNSEMHCTTLTYNDISIDVHKVTSKFAYNSFISIKKEMPTAIAKWDNAPSDPSNWKYIFRLPYASCRETQLQDLHYRIIHRYFPCNKWLFDVTILRSNTCNFCNLSDTIEHYFYACTSVQNFWVELENWWNNNNTCPVVLTQTHVIFGIYYDLKYFECINYIILFAKMFIYKRKLNKCQVLFKEFKKVLKNRLDIEKTIYASNNNIPCFNKKWLATLNSLSL